MNKNALKIIIAVILTVLVAIWIYILDSKTDINNSTKNIKISEEIKSNKNEVVTSGKTYTQKKRSATHMRQSFDTNIDDLQYAIYAEDEETIENAVENLAHCNNCIDQLKNVLGDSSYEIDVRKHAAQALLQSSSREGVLAVIDFIMSSDLMEQYKMNLTEEEFMRMFAEGDPFETDQKAQADQNLREELKKMLAEVASLENVPVLVDVLTGKEKDFSNVMEVPGDVRDAIVNAIRNVSDKDSVGKILAGQYNPELSPEMKNKLISIGHPKMDAILAAEAYKQGNDEEILVFTEQLEILDDVRTIEGVMYLISEGHAPVDEVANILYQWAENYPYEKNFDILGQNLRDSSKTPEERAISAYALSAMRDSNKALDILEDVYNSESDPLVLDYIELAFDEIERHIDESET